MVLSYEPVLMMLKSLRFETTEMASKVGVYISGVQNAFPRHHQMGITCSKKSTFRSHLVTNDIFSYHVLDSVVM